MKKVKESVQELYQEKVVTEFHYLAWLTPRELLQEYKAMRFPWRYRERKWIKEEIESRCVY